MAVPFFPLFWLKVLVISLTSSALFLTQHIWSAKKKSFHSYFQNMPRTQPLLTTPTATTLVQATIISCLNYCFSFPVIFLDSVIDLSCSVFNTAVRMILLKALWCFPCPTVRAQRAQHDPHWSPCCFLNIPSIFLLQGLCTCFSLYVVGSSPRYLHGSFPHFLLDLYSNITFLVKFSRPTFQILLL